MADNLEDIVRQLTAIVAQQQETLFQLNETIKQQNETIKELQKEIKSLSKTADIAEKNLEKSTKRLEQKATQLVKESVVKPRRVRDYKKEYQQRNLKAKREFGVTYNQLRRILRKQGITQKELREYRQRAKQPIPGHYDALRPSIRFQDQLPLLTNNTNLINKIDRQWERKQTFRRDDGTKGVLAAKTLHDLIVRRGMKEEWTWADFRLWYQQVLEYMRS